jgi:hypothetical protein
MRDWFYEASAKDLAAVQQAQAEFRKLWSQMQHPPFAAAFTGEATEIRAMDYLHYEGFADPPCDTEGAALVWGEVLRQAADMHWVMSYRGDLMLASTDEDTVIWPFPRAFEVRRRSIPQFDKYQWAMEQAIVELILCVVPDETKHRLFSLIPPKEDGYSQTIADSKYVTTALREWRTLHERA